MLFVYLKCGILLEFSSYLYVCFLYLRMVVWSGSVSFAFLYFGSCLSSMLHDLYVPQCLQLTAIVEKKSVNLKVLKSLLFISCLCVHNLKCLMITAGRQLLSDPITFTPNFYKHPTQWMSSVSTYVCVCVRVPILNWNVLI